MLYQPTESESINGTEVQTRQEKDVQGATNGANISAKLIVEPGSKNLNSSEVAQQLKPGNNDKWTERSDQSVLDTGTQYNFIQENDKFDLAENGYEKSIDNLNWFVAGIGIVIPLLIFIINAILSNSLYLSCIFSALALATIFIIYSILSFQYKANGMLTTYMKKGIGFVMLSFVIIFSYFQFLEYSTILEPQFSKERIQTGFGLNTFSLTSEGLQLSQKYPNKTAAELMLIVDDFNHAKATKILWKNWTIIVAGVSLHLLYMGLFLSWIIGFYFLVKDKKRITADFFKMKLEFNKVMDYPSMS